MSDEISPPYTLESWEAKARRRMWPTEENLAFMQQWPLYSPVEARARLLVENFEKVEWWPGWIIGWGAVPQTVLVTNNDPHKDTSKAANVFESYVCSYPPDDVRRVAQQ